MLACPAQSVASSSWKSCDHCFDSSALGYGQRDVVALLDSAESPDFIDQYVIGAANQSGPLYTTSLPTVATPGGPEAFTNSSYSESEGELTLSTNGQYLVTAGYDDTVRTLSHPGVLERPLSPEGVSIFDIAEHS